MISPMPWPICVKLAGVVGGNSESDLGQKNQKVHLEFGLKKFAQPCTSGTAADNLRGFEDCRKLYTG